MGYYLNNRDALSQYESESKKPFFVDKTTMLEKLIPWVEIGNYHICLTRPRRFGKSVMATMVGAFFGKGCDSSAVFDKLEIAKHPLYRKHRNQSNVCYIDFSKAANASSGYEEFIALIQNRIKTDLVTAYPSVDFSLEGSVYDYLKTVHERTGDTFLFVFDEWDAVFHKSYIDDASRCAFLEFLCLLTKGVSYLSLTYMTGILPIAKYSSGSAMNHVQEYSMISDRRFRTYFGFTEAEVDELFERYRKEAQEDDELTREGLREWYDGYCTSKGERLYNPKSVVNAFENESLQSYWTRTGPFEEISDYILEDVEGIKGCVLLMLAGERIDADIRESSAVFR